MTTITIDLSDHEIAAVDAVSKAYGTSSAGTVRAMARVVGCFEKVRPDFPPVHRAVIDCAVSARHPIGLADVSAKFSGYHSNIATEAAIRDLAREGYLERAKSGYVASVKAHAWHALVTEAERLKRGAAVAGEDGR